MYKTFKVIKQAKKLLNMWKEGKERKTERKTNKLINIIYLHYNLKCPGSNLEFSVPQNMAVPESWSPAPTSVSVLHLMGSHRYAYRHPCSTSKWSLLVPRGAYSSGATCPKEDIPGKAAMQALKPGSRPSEQGILGSRNSQCDLAGERVVLLSWTPHPVGNEGF